MFESTTDDRDIWFSARRMMWPSRAGSGPVIGADKEPSPVHSPCPGSAISSVRAQATLKCRAAGRHFRKYARGCVSQCTTQWERAKARTVLCPVQQVVHVDDSAQRGRIHTSEDRNGASTELVPPVN